MRTRLIIAGMLAATGLVWVGQGLGLLRGSSFMVDDIRWTVAGVVLLVIAAIIGVWTMGRRRRR